MSLTLRLRIVSPVLTLLAFGAPLAAQQMPAPAPLSRNGFSVQRLARIDSFYQRAVDRGQITGAVVLVLRDGKTAYERAFGWADREANRRMTPDVIFRIASQSKAITSVAVLALAEEGKLGLGDPVSRFIPAFAKTSVA